MISHGSKFENEEAARIERYLVDIQAAASTLPTSLVDVTTRKSPQRHVRWSSRLNVILVRALLLEEVAVFKRHPFHYESRERTRHSGTLEPPRFCVEGEVEQVRETCFVHSATSALGFMRQVLRRSFICIRQPDAPFAMTLACSRASRVM